MSRDTRAFEQQFRWEEGRWIFRYRQGGAPHVVTADERRQLVDMHRRRLRVAIGAMFLAMLTVVALARSLEALGVPQAWLPALYLAFPVTIFLPLHFWASNLVTLPLRRRAAVGERLGAFGRYKMRAETMKWSDVLIGIAAMAPLTIMPAAFRAYALPVTILGIVVGLNLTLIVLIKWTADQRARRADAWSRTRDRAQDLRRR